MIKIYPVRVRTPLLGAFVVLILAYSLAIAHGEDKPGPHGGYVRMPGAFHTELVQKSKDGFNVYLLDMEWKNPIVTGSTVEVTFNGKDKVVCQPKADYFWCAKKLNLKKGDQISLIAKRNGQSGGAALYEWPLKFFKTVGH